MPEYQYRNLGDLMIQNLDFWIAVAGLISALTIDIVNMRFLVKLWRWSQHAGANLIGQVTRALNLKSGGMQPVIDAIGEEVNTEQIQEQLQKFSSMPPEVLQKNMNALPIGEILGGLLTGNLKVNDLRQYAPLLIQYLRQNQSDNSGVSGSDW